jgi:5-deoxy-glucuronate isomerase
MPKPSFGIQMIYDDLDKVDFISPVFENDAVVIKEGYHPNTSIPGFSINFVWMMAALSPPGDREWGDMHWQEEFEHLYEK